MKLAIKIVLYSSPFRFGSSNSSMFYAFLKYFEVVERYFVFYLVNGKLLSMANVRQKTYNLIPCL